MSSRFVVVASLFFGLFLAPWAKAQELFRPKLDAKSIEATFGTYWYGIYMKDKDNGKDRKIGFFQSSRGKANNQIRDSFNMTMKITSMEMKVEVNVSQFRIFEAEAPYRLVSGELKQDFGPKLKLTTAFKAEGKGYQVNLTSNDVVRKRQVDGLDYTLTDAIAPDIWLSGGPKLGAKIMSKELDPQEMVLDDSTFMVTAIKNSLVNGVNVRYFEVDSVAKRTGFRAVTLYDDQGRSLSAKIAEQFELRRETEEQAKNTEYSQDLFVLGMAKIDRPLGSPFEIQSLVLEVDAKETEGFEDGPRQAFTKAENGKRLIKLGKQYGKPAKATAKEIEEALQETNAYAILDPKVKTLALKAVGDAKTPEEKVKRIVLFVNHFIKPQLTSTIPTIHDLMEKRHGDCKSFALLTTTLCRAAGVPAREVSGLVYMGDEQKAFGGHAWNEVVLGGVWVPVDASRGQTELDAGHICFGADQKASKNMLATLGKLSFRLVEVERAK